MKVHEYVDKYGYNVVDIVNEGKVVSYYDVSKEEAMADYQLEKYFEEECEDERNRGGTEETRR